MTQKRGGGPQKGPGGGQRQMHVRLKTARKHRPSSQRWLERQLNDPYVAASKRDGMRSRAAYKLSEIDDKYRLLKPGALVVDLGAAPGGWSQIAAERVQSIGGKGQVVAIDILPMEPLAGVESMQLDFTEEGAEAKLKALMRDGHADIVLSDMAAPTTGHTRTDHLRIMGLAEAAGYFACDVLRPGRHVHRQGAAGRHRARAARPVEAALRHRAPRQAAGEPLRQRRALRRGHRLPPGERLTSPLWVGREDVVLRLHDCMAR